MLNCRPGLARNITVTALSTLFCVATAFASAESASPDELISSRVEGLRVVGPVQGVDLVHGVIFVAGQAVSIGQATRFSYGGVVGALAIEAVHAGDMIAVYGPIDGPAVSVNRLIDQYVAGATSIFVKGRVTSAISSVGRAQVGGLIIDFTPAMADTRLNDIGAGYIIEAFGTQPVPGGLLLAESVVDGSANSNVGTSEDASIVGTSFKADSIVGTSKQAASIVGTSFKADSIVGTSKQAASIVGTSFKADSIVGTSKQAASIVGTSFNTDSIVGTSKQTASIVGTSFKADSIVGTSKQAASIVGTSFKANSIVGTSKQAASIVGTSFNTDSIVGTSKQTASIVGTSFKADSIVGTSEQAASIVGTSFSTDSIVGTSKQTASIVGTSFQAN